MNSNTPQGIVEDRALGAVGGNLAATWREFVAGMHFLLRYGRHNTADNRAIACDNLRLLHHALQKDSGYRRLLKAACAESASQSVPTSRNLVHDATLQADVVSLPAGCHLGISDQDGRFTLLLLLAGEAVRPLPALHSERRSWWRPGSDGQPSQRLRNGEALIAPRTLTHLIAAAKGCVVLRVCLPLSQEATAGEQSRLYLRKTCP